MLTWVILMKVKDKKNCVRLSVCLCVRCGEKNHISDIFKLAIAEF